MESGDDVALYDLLQTRPKQVSVTVTVIINKQKIIMEPGRMLVLTKKDTPDFSKLEINCCAVNHTNVQQIDLHSNEVNAYIANFSIVSALQTVEPLKRLAISTYKQDKVALAKQVKNATILEDLGATPAVSAEAIITSPAAPQPLLNIDGQS
jgi:hypothetical protein